MFCINSTTRCELITMFNVHSSAWVISCTRKRAVTAATRLGLNGARDLSHEISRGYRLSRFARYGTEFPARIISSDQLLNDTQRPFSVPLFFSSDLIITTSPIAGTPPPVPVLARCFSRRSRKYSLDHRRHIASSHFSKGFARLRMSALSMRCGSNSGSKLLFKNSRELGVISGNCTSFPR